MPHGTPDWGLVGPKYTTYGLDDLGEHAVRLGSPHFFDRRGDVLFLTDFSEGFSVFDQGGAGAGWDVCLATAHSRTGAYCAKLVAGAGDTNYARLLGEVGLPIPSRLGLEFSFGDVGSIGLWYGYLDWYDGARHYMSRIRVASTTGVVDYYDNVTPWVNIDTIGALRSVSHPIHTLKLVADMSSSQYVRLIMNTYLFPLVGIPVPSVVALVAPYIQFEIWYVNVADPITTGYVDNVIVTHNEP